MTDGDDSNTPSKCSRVIFGALAKVASIKVEWTAHREMGSAHLFFGDARRRLFAKPKRSLRQSRDVWPTSRWRQEHSMARTFDPGYAAEPFRTLAAEAPGSSVYPGKDFRVEWGPVFHRGRLDGSAKLLIIGQDPAQHETILRRILVGEAGHRIQGFLAKLGLDRSYVMVNTYLYSVFGQGGGNRHKDDKAIARYRHRWLKALLDTNEIEAVVTLGTLAHHAWDVFRASTDGANLDVKFAAVTHPTAPESAGGSAAQHAAAVARMLENWNAALQSLHPLLRPDRPVQLRRYGTSFQKSEKVEIPEVDVPAWAPDWMRLNDGWADRPGTGRSKRASILVKVPSSFLP